MWDGTPILTAQGPIPLETLTAGCEILTASGQLRRVGAVGRLADETSLSSTIRITAGGLGDTHPGRDIFLPSAACLLLDGHLVAARSLVNGATIRRHRRSDAPQRWQVMLEGCEAPGVEDLEPYVPLFHRDGFVHADCDIPPARQETAAPAAMKRRLLDVAAGLGHVSTDDPGLHVLIDGTVILPRSTRSQRYIFALPPGASALRLVSRVWVPAEMLPESDDERVLGVCVRRLVLDGHELDLADLDAGWDKLEDHGTVKPRWTKGSAVVPLANRRYLDVELYGFRRYWRASAPGEADPG